MLHILSSDRRDLEGHVLRGMFEARKRVFVDLLGWDVPVIDGRYEVDQFDDHHATYLVVTDDAGEHRASARLLPTTRPHILDSFFGALCEGDPPCGDHVFEITRFCLDRRSNSRSRRDARDALVRSIADYGVASGISLYTGVAEIGWLQQILAFGWRCRPLGLPKRIAGALLGALAIEISEETPSLLVSLLGAPADAIAIDEAEVRRAA